MTTPPNHRTSLGHALACVVIFGVVLVIAGSVLPDPTQRALGHPGNDVWNHVWGYWWVGSSIFDGTTPTATTLLAWPNGGSLWFIDNFNAILSLPLQALFGPVAAYNAAIGFNLALCGVAAYALAYRVTENVVAAAVGGVAYMTTPHLVSQVYNGVSEAVSAGWLPLAVLFLRETAHHPTRRNALLAGAFTGLTGLANWYYGLSAGLVAGALLARALLQWARLPRWRRKPRLNVAKAGAVLMYAGLAAGLLLLLPALSFRASLVAKDALVSRNADFVWMSQVMHNMTDLVTLFHPGKFYSPDLRALQGEDLIGVSYLGLTLVFTALWAVQSSARRQASSWFALFGGFTMLALGPYLYVGGAYPTLDGGWLGLPLLALREWVPIFGSISHANRFVVGSGLALSVIAAIAVGTLARRGPMWLAVGPVLGISYLTEALVASPAVWPIPYATFSTPSVYARLEPGAVLDLPLCLPVLGRSRLLAHQLIHQQPVPYGLNDPFPPFIRANHYTAMVIALERWTITYTPTDLPWLDLAAGQEQLRTLGLRHIIVDKSGYNSDQLSRVSRFLDLTVARLYDDERVRVYALREP